MMVAGANASEGKYRDDWMRKPGSGMGESGPSIHESHIKRSNVASQPGTLGSGASRTPLQFLDGIITPSRLHFERHHSGIPDINPQSIQRNDGCRNPSMSVPAANSQRLAIAIT